MGPKRLKLKYLGKNIFNPYVILAVAATHIKESIFTFLEFIIAWLLRYLGAKFVLFSVFLGAALAHMRRSPMNHVILFI